MEYVTLIEHQWMFVFIAGLVAWQLFRSRLPRRWRVAKSKRLLTKLRSIDFPPRLFAYLRKIDPFVFEELLLTCFEERGYPVRRNKRYTGDGGSDGIIFLNGQRVHVQAKRYQKHIKAEHVRALIDLAKAKKSKVVLVHTGRTGKLARQLLANQRLDCISGQRLISLINGDPLFVHGISIRGTTSV